MGSTTTSPRGRHPMAWLATATFALTWLLTPPVHATAQTDLPLTTDLVVVNPQGVELPRSGGSALLRATVTSQGRVAAPSSQVVVTLPAGVDHDPTVPGANAACTAVGARVTCPLGTISPGGSVPLAIGIRSGPLAPGELAAVVGPPTSGRWDLAAGELHHRSWNVEAGGEGASLLACWPLDNPSPNMDLTGGGPNGDVPCDGTNDRPPLRPDVDELQSAFPAAYSEPVTRSWEWRTRITPAWTGAYRICAAGIDDGGYVAVSPAGIVPEPGDVAVDVTTFTAGVSEGRVDMEAGKPYDLLIRISNRGAAGVDNGGSAPGGWSYVGVAPFIEACSPGAAGALAVGAPGFTPAVSIPIRIVGVAAVRITGTVTTGDRDFSVARAVNDGPDPTFAVPTATGGIDQLAAVALQPGEAAIWATALDPSSLPPGSVPWTVRTLGTVPP